jgi:hypothetical protein
VAQVTRTQYTMARYAEGKRIGLPFSFDSITKAREYARDAARSGNLPIHEFTWHENIRDCNRPDGLCIDEIRTIHREGALNGERIVA